MIDKKDIKYLVVHCTDSDRDRTTIEQVDFWHKQLGWKSEKSGKHIGYHFFIDGLGRIHEGRKIYKNDLEKGSHALGLNFCSIGICLALKKGQDISVKQRSNLKTLLKKLSKELNIEVDNIIGHRDVWKIVKDRKLATECPTDSLYNELQKIKKEMV
jgi:N-acetyl-anhydromuramyl-L-alanine amidase AmpD